jgi:signal transduction histidine kinase
MQDLEQSWKGIATITYDIDEDFGDSSHSRDTAMQLVEEGIVNSIRHGKANQIHVAIRASSASIEISVSDDGVFAGPSKSSGLGSILFDTFTSSWSINRELGTTVLRMSIAQTTQ